MVGQGAADGLTNPPGGVGGELEASAVVKLLDRPHQPDVAFLDQIQERNPAAGVFFGYRDDEP
jgi:hypothetical protein